MKTKAIFIMFIVFFFITACKKKTKATISEAETTKTEVTESSYTINPESHILWRADKLVGYHDGTFNTSEGVLYFEDNTLKGGQAIFDINTLKVNNVPVEDKDYAKLTNHLLSPDFFEAEKYPTANFEITEVNGNEITGNLTLKGITKSISFNTNISNNEETASITSDVFTIDRTVWDIKYNSGKFADPAKLGDFLIKDDVEITVTIKATKQH